MFGIIDFIGHVVEPVTTVTLNDSVEPGTRQPIIRVYTKAKWADSWVLDDTLLCTFAEFELNPKMPTAELSRRYGHKLINGVWTVVQALRNDYRRYIKIRFSPWDTGEDELIWYGITGAITQEDGGTLTRDGSAFPVGRQLISCTGLEKLLLDTRIIDSAFYDDINETVSWVRRGLTFNSPLETTSQSGNRSTLKHGGSYVFSNQVRGAEAYWNTQNIVEYLLEYHQPTGFNQADNIPFVISADSLAFLGAGIYRPMVETDGRTVKDILDQIVYRKRLQAYYLTVNDSNEIEVVVTSLSHRTLAINSELMALPNSNKLRVNAELLPCASTVYYSQHEPVDIVRYRGAKARVVCTISYEDGTLVKGWTTGQETEYEAGASNEVGYAATKSYEKLKAWNAAVRSQFHLREVYAFFQLPDEWDMFAADGLGGAATSILDDNGVLGTFGWAFSGTGDDRVQSNYFEREVFIVNQSPLKYGLDYDVNADGSGNITPNELYAVQHKPLGTLVFMYSEVEDKYYQLEKIGLAGDIATHYTAESFEWSASVRVEDRSRGFFVDVMGRPQHIIAKADFTPLSRDSYAYDKVKKPWDWQKMVATVTIEMPFRCEGAYPAAVIHADKDYLREVTIYAGEQYKLDWLHPYTVVGVTGSGTLIQNSTGGFLQNDQRKLRERAELAYDWYRLPRASVQFSTLRIGNYVPLGSMIRFYGGTYYIGLSNRETNSVVTTIRIDCPLGTIDSPSDGIRMTVTTDYMLDIDLL